MSSTVLDDDSEINVEEVLAMSRATRGHPLAYLFESIGDYDDPSDGLSDDGVGAPPICHPEARGGEAASRRAGIVFSTTLTSNLSGDDSASELDARRVP